MTKDGSAWTQPLTSFFKSLWEPTLGKVWDSSTADDDFRKGNLCSKGNGKAVRVAFRNATPLPLILCWVNEQGIPHHYYQLPPSPNNNLYGPISSLDHVERTNVGHAFCLALCDDGDDTTVNKDGNLENVIAGYRPSIVDSNDELVHLVTISPGKSSDCCRGVAKDFLVSVRLGQVDPAPLDTSEKVYERSTLGGWPVRLEKQWHGGDRKLKRLFEDHLRTATKFLPEHARDCLRKSTPFYINKSQSYGPAACPVKGRGMCFHPGSDWLETNGMCTDKKECVEVYKCEEYLKDSQLWGPGGVFLHELCHAYHWKMVPGGYGNPDIRKCYEQAMKEGLYEKVKFHRGEGCSDVARAYACENEMEYFAELSVAFLAGKDKKVEYNKWQPFNRHELKKFDPRAYKLLKRIWKVDCGEDSSEEEKK